MAYILYTTLVLAISTSLTQAKLPLEDSTAIINQLFTYAIDPQDFPNTQIKVTETGQTGLPSWLTYDSTTNELSGVPTAKDKGTVILSAGEEMFAVTVTDPSRSQVAQPVASTEEIVCKPHDSITLVYVKLNGDADSMSGHQRSKLVRGISEHLSLQPQHISLSSRPTDLLESTAALVSGAGDMPTADDSLSVLSWIVGCGPVMAHHMDILEKVESSAKDGSMSKLLETPVSGWQVQNNQPKVISKRRLKRAFVTATPNPEEPTADVTTPMTQSTPEPSRTTVTPSQTTPEPTTPSTPSTMPTEAPVVTEPPVINEKPVVDNMKLPEGGMLPGTLTGGMVYEWTIPQDLFTDSEGEELTYEIEDNEGDSSWVILSHQNSDMLKCVADMNFADSKEMLTLTATDASGMSASVTLKADHGPNMKSALTEIYEVEVSHSKHKRDKALRNIKLAADMERAAEISNILITDIRELSPGKLAVKFGANNGDQSSCPDDDNTMVREAIEGSVGRQDTFVIQKFTGFERQMPCEYSAPVVDMDVLAQISPITIQLGELTMVDIPANLFSDEIDMDLSSDKMMIRLLADGLVDSSSWITLNSKTRQIKALTWEKPESPPQFSLEVTNSMGKTVEQPIEIQVVDNSESKPATNLFSLTLDGDYSKFSKDQDAQISLYNNLLKAFPAGTKVVIRSVKSGSIVVEYSLENENAYSSPDECPADIVRSYTDSTFDNEGNIKDSFADSLGDYNLQKAEFTPQGACEGEFEPLSAAAKNTGKKEEKENGGNMTVIIIVIIVVLVLIIVVVIIVVCVIKKRRSQKAHVNGKNGSYIEKGVPVVMEEEMKDVSKAETTPLVSGDSAEVSYKPTPPAYPGDNKSDDKYHPPTPPTSEPED